MKKNRILTIVVTINVIIVNLLVPLIFWANFRPMYDKFFEKYDVLSDFSSEYTDQEISQNFDEVLKYISFRKSSINPEFFSYEDIEHMQDVRAIFAFIYFLAVTSFVSFTTMRFLDQRPDKFLLPGVVGTFLILMTIVVTYFIVGFENIFINLHKAIFTNEYWMLDPNNSNLIKFFPIGIFQDMGVLIFLSSMLFTASELTLAYLLKSGRNETLN